MRSWIWVAALALGCQATGSGGTTQLDAGLDGAVAVGDGQVPPGDGDPGDADPGDGAVGPDSSGADGAATVDGGLGGPTWYGGVQALVHRRCGRCHQPGGVGPFSLTEYDSARDFADDALDAMESGRMPPWMPSSDCRTYQHERRITAGERALFRSWVEAGTPEGEGEATAPPEDPAMGEADIVTSPNGPYLPDDSRPDDYRCFLLDAEFPVDTWLTTGWVVPGAKSLVHHVLLYNLQRERVAEFAARDGEGGQPGSRCFGASQGGPIGWWVPGSQPFELEADAGKLIPAGSRIVMQIHYNLLADAPRPDLTRVHLVVADAPPAFRARTAGLANGDIPIEAGDPESVHTRTWRNDGDGDWVIVEIAGHMHLLGTSIRVEVERAGGGRECLLDIPRWDFNWQQFYRLPADELVRVRPGDALRLTCVYDNSAGNQPVVNGEQLPPRDVRWGEGTLDEMCLSYVTVLEATGAGAGGACEGFGVCRGGCQDPERYACVLECSFGNADCGSCLVQGFFGEDGCARGACGRQAQQATACYNACRQRAVAEGVELVDCMRAECPAELGGIDDCVSEVLATGVCTDALLGCGAR